jgi:hypothetical protein
MRIERRAVAIVLYGGWLLLSNPDPGRPQLSLGQWKKVGDYDTGYECEQHRKEEVHKAQEKDAKAKSPTHLTALDTDFTFRCARVEQVAPLKK